MFLCISVNVLIRKPCSCRDRTNEISGDVETIPYIYLHLFLGKNSLFVKLQRAYDEIDFEFSSKTRSHSSGYL